MSDEATQAMEWEALYDELLQLLGRYGINDAFGKGDFFLVDDNYSSPNIKYASLGCLSSLDRLPRIYRDRSDDSLFLGRLFFLLRWMIVVTTGLVKVSSSVRPRSWNSGTRSN